MYIYNYSIFSNQESGIGCGFNFCLSIVYTACTVI